METGRKGRAVASVDPEISALTGPIPRPRVKAAEWVVAVGGLTVFSGLFMDWSNGVSGFGSLSVLKLILLAIAAGAVALPVVVGTGAKPDLPIVWETFLSTLALLGTLLLILRLIWAPSGGLGTGFFVVAAGSLLVTFFGWRSVAREC